MLWGDGLSRTHLALAELCLEEDELSDAHTHIEHAKSYAGDDTVHLGCAVYLGACVLYERKWFEEGRPEALRALTIYQKLGAMGFAEEARQVLEKMV